MDKQIEEMAKLIQINYECPFSFAEGMAEFLHDEGYRKASDVAREIFENIRTKCVDSDGYFLYGTFMNLQLDTMKKYESEGEG